MVTYTSGPSPTRSPHPNPPMGPGLPQGHTLPSFLWAATPAPHLPSHSSPLGQNCHINGGGVKEHQHKNKNYHFSTGKATLRAPGWLPTPGSLASQPHPRVVPTPSVHSPKHGPAMAGIPPRSLPPRQAQMWHSSSRQGDTLGAWAASRARWCRGARPSHGSGDWLPPLRLVLSYPSTPQPPSRKEDAVAEQRQ